MKTGWLAPDNTLIECPDYKHVVTACKHPALSKLFPELDSRLASVAQVEASCQAASDAGEHPEWHCYENASSDLDWDIVAALMKNGAVRIASTPRELCCEGKAETLADKRDRLQKLAEQENLTLKLEPCKWLK